MSSNAVMVPKVCGNVSVLGQRYVQSALPPALSASGAAAGANGTLAFVLAPGPAAELFAVPAAGAVLLRNGAALAPGTMSGHRRDSFTTSRPALVPKPLKKSNRPSRNCVRCWRARRCVRI